MTISILPRLCLNCGGPEDQHAAGQCLFAATFFEPHRLSGGPREPRNAPDLWEPVTVDVAVTQHPENEYFRGPMHTISPDRTFYVGGKVSGTIGIVRTIFGDRSDD